MNAIPEKDNELLLELVNYQYGYIGYCLGFDKKDEARELLHAAQKNLEILEDRKYSLSIINSYKSAFYGFRIGLNPITAPVNGFKALDCARTALKLILNTILDMCSWETVNSLCHQLLAAQRRKPLNIFWKPKNL